MVGLGRGSDQGTAAMLAEIADLPYFRVDAERNVVEMSPAMERLTGFRAADVVGSSCLNVHRCEECLRGCGVFEHRRVVDRHVELYTADGSVVAASKSGAVLLNEQGEITGAIEVLRPLPAASEPAVAAAPNVEGDRNDDEVDLIRHALQKAQFRRREAARALGMSRTTLWRKMREYGL